MKKTIDLTICDNCGKEITESEYEDGEGLCSKCMDELCYCSICGEELTKEEKSKTEFKNDNSNETHYGFCLKCQNEREESVRLERERNKGLMIALLIAGVLSAINFILLVKLHGCYRAILYWIFDLFGVSLPF
jgi:hypothetical protein